MRPRIALTLVLCLLTVSVAVPGSAQEFERDRGGRGLQVRDLWSGLVAWILEYGLTADPNGLSVETNQGGDPLAAGIPFNDDRPSYGLTADPNG